MLPRKLTNSSTVYILGVPGTNRALQGLRKYSFLFRPYIPASLAAKRDAAPKSPSDIAKNRLYPGVAAESTKLQLRN